MLAGELGGALRSSAERPLPVVAAGAVDIEESVAAGGTARVKVPLFAPSDLHRTTRVRRAGRIANRRERIVKAGTAIGECVICVALLG
jgi:hypothetical protein